MMSRKDYYLFADMLSTADELAVDGASGARILDYVIRRMTKILKYDNPNFDEVKFTKACSWIERQSAVQDV